jgi:hypothetical protein
MTNKDEEKPRKIRTTLEELEVMEKLKDSMEWAVLKRWMQRYINNLTRIAFNLSYSASGEDFKVAHRDLTAESRALKNLVRVVEKAGERLEKREEEK